MERDFALTRKQEDAGIWELKLNNMYFVYILKTSGNTLYIGQTGDLEKRLKEHREKSVRSAKYIKYFDSFKLVYSETFKTRSEAMHREAQLKKLSRSQKEAIITK